MASALSDNPHRCRARTVSADTEVLVQASAQASRSANLQTARSFFGSSPYFVDPCLSRY